MALVTRKQPSSVSLYLLPIAELLLFVAAVLMFPTSVFLGALLLFLAALALCLSLHLSYHEVAHRSGRWPIWRRVLTGLSLTPLMGVSFHGYRISHWNHHRTNNGLDDITTTWVDAEGGPRPRNVAAYCLSWPKVFFTGPIQFKTALADGDASARVVLWSALESVLQLTWVILLGLLTPVTLLLYVALIYIGWALISLQNYGQHLPVNYRSALRTTSFHNTLYNRFLHNNGLHQEHHQIPAKPIRELEADISAQQVTVPHLLAPFAARE
jgi:fatty acid desaturase